MDTPKEVSDLNFPYDRAKVHKELQDSGILTADGTITVNFMKKIITTSESYTSKVKLRLGGDGNHLYLRPTEVFNSTPVGELEIIMLAVQNKYNKPIAKDELINYCTEVLYALIQQYRGYLPSQEDKK